MPALVPLQRKGNISTIYPPLSHPQHPGCLIHFCNELKYHHCGFEPKTWDLFCNSDPKITTILWNIHNSNFCFLFLHISTLRLFQYTYCVKILKWKSSISKTNSEHWHQIYHYHHQQQQMVLHFPASHTHTLYMFLLLHFPASHTHSTFSYFYIFLVLTHTLL